MNIDKYTIRKVISNNIIDIKTDLNFDEAYELCTIGLNPNNYHIMMKIPVKKIIDAAAAGSIILVGYEENINTKTRYAENFMIKQNNFL